MNFSISPKMENPQLHTNKVICFVGLTYCCPSRNTNS